MAEAVNPFPTLLPLDIIDPPPRVPLRGSTPPVSEGTYRATAVAFFHTICCPERRRDKSTRRDQALLTTASCTSPPQNPKGSALPLIAFNIQARYAHRGGSLELTLSDSAPSCVSLPGVSCNIARKSICFFADAISGGERADPLSSPSPNACPNSHLLAARRGRFRILLIIVLPLPLLRPLVMPSGLGRESRADGREHVAGCLFPCRMRLRVCRQC